VVGNERLTGLTGAVLLVLTLVEIATVPTLRNLLTAHFFVGVLLAGPVLLKTASTGWRFLRYYTRSREYRRKGPPRPLMRVLGPLLIVSTLLLIGSGVALAITGPAPTILVRLHIVSFLVWLVIIAIHVAVYVRKVPSLVADDWRRSQTPPHVARVPGRGWRLGVNIAALIAGAIGAILLLPTANAWTGWLGQSVTGPGVLAIAVTVGTVIVVILRHRRG
jgi:hypothetical protein